VATVTSIATALMDTLNTALADVDYASIDEYLPSVKTEKVALLVTPAGQADVGRFQSFASNLELTHRIRCEFWVKIDKADMAATMSRAREIPLDAMRILLSNDGASYELAPNTEMESSTTDGPVTTGNASYLVAALIVPCWNQVEVI